MSDAYHSLIEKAPVGSLWYNRAHHTVMIVLGHERNAPYMAEGNPIIRTLVSCQSFKKPVQEFTCAQEVLDKWDLIMEELS